MAGDAALLCAHLARGRHAPELTARTLLVSTPPWLVDLGADGYAALADFAASHAADTLASEVFLAGATRFPSRELPFTVNAGMLLLDSDRDRARELLESARAMSSGFNARIEIGFLILDHPGGNAAPIQIPAATTSLWVPNIVSPYATWEYSRIRPPSRSRRRTLTLGFIVGGRSRPAGGL